MGFLRGQGATEYLVLLAIVLIVALVSVALLGFFPGMASDSQRTQAETYWKSASPIAITEWAALHDGSYTIVYFRIRNTGAYAIRITKVIGADGTYAHSFWSDQEGLCGLSQGAYSISDYYYLAPGEEKYFGLKDYFGTPCDRYIGSIQGASTWGYIGGASTICAYSATSPGMLTLKSMGFEYIEYIDNQQITKRQIGKQVIIKCLPGYGL